MNEDQVDLMMSWVTNCNLRGVKPIQCVIAETGVEVKTPKIKGPRSINRHHKLMDLKENKRADPVIKLVMENDPEIHSNDMMNILDHFMDFSPTKEEKGEGNTSENGE